MIALSPALSALPALLAAAVASICLILLQSPGRFPRRIRTYARCIIGPFPEEADWRSGRDGWLATVWLAAPQPGSRRCC